MAKRIGGVGKMRTTRGHKTEKRLAAKKARLAELAAKRAKYAKKKAGKKK